MVIVKINSDTPQEREVEIVTEKGPWDSGSYHLFAATFLTEEDMPSPEPHNTKSSNFLGELIIDKLKEYWEYKGDKLTVEEQTQIAGFIMDYQAPDGVY